jgi:hypothetical protein
LDPLDQVQKELLRPDFQRLAFAYEGSHLFPKFSDLHLPDALTPQLQQPYAGERFFVAVVAGLSPSLEKTDMFPWAFANGPVRDGDRRDRSAPAT